MFFSFILLVVLVTAAAEDNCHQWSDSFSDYLGTKTPYRLIENKNDSKPSYRGCKPTKIWMMVRHGTRYPGAEFITNVNKELFKLRGEILEGFEKGKHSLCQDVGKRFVSSVPYFDLSKEKHLGHEGEEEMVELAERFQNRFPELFPKEYSSAYKFRSTETQRAMESKRYFLIGLFGRKTAQSVWPLSDKNEVEVIRFYKFCPRWKRDVDDNPLSLLARLKFENTEEWSDMTRNISERLGLDYVINQVTLHTMYTLCGFETSLNRKNLSPWCAVFTQPELAALEVAEDLEYYFIDGYGYQLNYVQACPAIRDLITHLTSDGEPRTSVSFSHSGTILKMLAHLGLYNDTDYRSVYDSPTRLWRVGKIDAFGSNLAFVLYQCGDEKKFLVLHQERQVVLNGCPKDDLCPLSVLLKAHGRSVKNCKFKEMCRIPEDNEVY